MGSFWWPLTPHPNSGTTGTGRPRSYRQPRSSDEQLSAIGLVGETLAYRWLQRTYKETTPDSWVSRNRGHLLGGHLGDDGLGYDFRIARKRETLLLEVKTNDNRRLRVRHWRV